MARYYAAGSPPSRLLYGRLNATVAAAAAAATVVSNAVSLGGELPFGVPGHLHLHCCYSPDPKPLLLHASMLRQLTPEESNRFHLLRVTAGVVLPVKFASRYRLLTLSTRMERF